MLTKVIHRCLKSHKQTNLVVVAKTIHIIEV
jgi:hypothetical protein